MNSVTRKKLEKRCAQFETGKDKADDVREELLRLEERVKELKKNCSLRYYPEILKEWKDAMRAMGKAESAVFLLHASLEEKADDLEEKLLRDRD